MVHQRAHGQTVNQQLVRIHYFPLMFWGDLPWLQEALAKTGAMDEITCKLLDICANVYNNGTGKDSIVLLSQVEKGWGTQTLSVDTVYWDFQLSLLGEASRQIEASPSR